MESIFDFNDVKFETKEELEIRHHKLKEKLAQSKKMRNVSIRKAKIAPKKLKRNIKRLFGRLIH